MHLRRAEMAREIIFLVEEDIDGGYTARALDYAIFTQAESLKGLKAIAQDAVRCHFKESERPSIIRLHIVKDEVIPV
jgi:hypothetical protein